MHRSWGSNHSLPGTGGEWPQSASARYQSTHPCGVRNSSTTRDESPEGWGDDAKGDGWICPRCKRTSTDAQYRFAVAHLDREEAHELTDRDMEIRTGVRAGTVRVWANRELVRKRRDSGRTLYAVEDVMREARTRGLVS